MDANITCTTTALPHIFIIRNRARSTAHKHVQTTPKYMTKKRRKKQSIEVFFVFIKLVSEQKKTFENFKVTRLLFFFRKYERTTIFSLC